MALSPATRLGPYEYLEGETLAARLVTQLVDGRLVDLQHSGLALIAFGVDSE